MAASSLLPKSPKLAAQGGTGDQTIRIEGGLPALPGTNVIMNETALGMNGHNGHPAIDHEPVNNSVNGANVTNPVPQFASRKLTYCKH